MARILPLVNNVLRFVSPRLQSLGYYNNFHSPTEHSLVTAVRQLHGLQEGRTNSFLQSSGSGWGLTFVRTVIRNHFPRPSERKRIKRHGWRVRMSTLPGRRILMRRILKGRHVLAH